ncbi:HlyD family type I secretion periplasmic adaptor subunit [Lentibacter sp. XHP0401]|uniref:HlyD family type I secretion periplasmic adaptor subunit n=1 Tax=Lentibacter sp. XHP0401 TaxID=2984334 RepID=UPI0021E6DE44|nr:HlyD family type I secretion periplasmic adaptor subunit [Lentibacter sp. XHP0401]MCV2893092.1 HlyD family type I secretion periplasmic adaptor subunit [Lentibacter sp. XHP0401]
MRRKWPVRMPVFVGLFALALLVGGFGGWSVFSSLAGAIVASGRVEVEQNRQIVQHPDGGVVAELMVQEGDRVTAGQVLINLDSKTLTSELNIVESQLFELMARRARLQAERDALTDLAFDPELVTLAPQISEVADLMEGQRRLFEARNESITQQRDQLAKQREQIGDQIRGIEAQTEALELQVALIGEELEAQSSLLERGLAQASRVLSLRREEARLLGEVGELRASKAQAQGRTTELDIESLKLTSSLREDAISQLRDLRVQELEFRERRTSLSERLSRLSIQAPASGIVYGLTVNTPRSVIRAAEPVLYIVPQDRPLVIAAQVPTIHVDKIYTGQSVNLRFSALDQRRTPELFGEVVRVSADAFTDDASGASYYRAEIALKEGELGKLPEGAALIPGMPAEAFILTSEQSPMDYLIKPFWDYFEQAFRE